MNGLGINSFQNINPDTTKIYAGDLYQECILSDNRIWAPQNQVQNDLVMSETSLI